MSARAARRLLFLAALLIAPVPMLGFGAFVPVARYVLLGAVCIGMRVAEGPGGVVWQLTALFLGHALVYAGLLWLAAWLAGRALGALPPPVRNAVVALLVVVGALWAVLSEPYVTPFGTTAHSDLFGVLR